MKLRYRGANYEYDPALITTTQSGIQGKYRGIPQQLR